VHLTRCTASALTMMRQIAVGGKVRCHKGVWKIWSVQSVLTDPARRFDGPKPARNQQNKAWEGHDFSRAVLVCEERLRPLRYAFEADS
jgi:hypothetical protein